MPRPTSFSAGAAGRCRIVQAKPCARCTNVRAAAKFIARTEVPAFIQRPDMMDQLFRWADLDVVADAVVNFGMPMSVEKLYTDEGAPWGFTIWITKDGEKLAGIQAKFDGEVAEKYEFVGRGANGMPTLEGNINQVAGKNFEIWKVDDNPVDEELRLVIRSLCESMQGAINRYYAFGSVWSEEI